MSKPLFFQRPFEYTYFKATLYIIALNILVYLLTMVYSDLVIYLSLCPRLMVQYKMFWQPVTYMFVHGGIQHIFFNLLALLCFGLTLERTLGSKEFLCFYFVCGISSGLLSFVFYMITGYYGVLLMGASGAVYALLFAYAVIFPRSLIYIWGIIPVPAPILVLVYALVEIISEVTGFRNGIAHFTHLFGFLAAFLYFVIRMKINPFKVWKNGF